MSKTEHRKEVDYQTDVLAYHDEEYLIFKKEGETTGTLEAPIEIAYIGVYGLKRLFQTLFNPQEQTQIVDDLIDELLAIRKDIGKTNED